jgi:hypothetical protein
MSMNEALRLAREALKRVENGCYGPDDIEDIDAALGCAAPQEPVARPIRSDLDFWMMYRSKIIDAITRAGFRLMSNAERFWLAPLQAAAVVPPQAAGVAPDERQAFEAWCATEGVDTTLWMGHAPEAGYANGRTLDYWAGWRARAELAAPQPAAAPVPSEEWIREAMRLADEYANSPRVLFTATLEPIHRAALDTHLRTADSPQE